MIMIPRHVAIIPDGNRRWAKAHKKSLVAGYLAGIDKVGDVLEWSRDLEVRNITFWGLSTENLSRNRTELSTLMRLFELKFKEAVKRNEFHEHKIRFRVFGDKSVLTKSIQNYINALEDSTRDYSNYFANVLLGYGGRQEIIAACNAAIRDYEARKIDKVDEASFSRYLYTGGLADPDLIIRTSGEQRLSGFLPWHSAYSEFYFSKHLWPEFTKQELGKAVDDYGERKRRFGR
jgi:tritrans,polycis-undecaprenyl-diphosphate synthase [geranylgeranyl-diphosphate specific]